MIRIIVLTCSFLIPLLIARQGRDYKMFAAEILAFSIVFAIISAGNRVKAPEGIKRQYFLPPIAWTIILLAGWANSIHASAGDELMRQLIYFSFLPLSALYLRKGDITRLTWIWMAGFVFVCSYAFLQRFGYEPIADFRKWNPQDRVFATFGNPDFLGAFSAFLIPLFLARIQHNRMRAVWIFSSAISIVTLYWTFSRGAWLGALAGVSVWGLLSFEWQTLRRLLPRTILVLSALFLVLSISGMIPWSTFTRRTDRIHLWEGTFRMISAKPVSGWGLASFASEFPPFAPPAFAARMKADNTFAEHPHSEYLHIAIECGIVGLGIFLWVLLWIGKTIFQTIRTSEGANLAGPLGALTAILVHISVDRNFRLASTAVPFWILAGATIANRFQPAYRNLKTSNITGSVLIRIIITGAVGAMCVFSVFRPLSASLRVEKDRDFLEQPTDMPISELEAQRSSRSGDPSWLISIGNAYAQDKQFSRASEAFSQALAIDPMNVSAANNLGNSYFMMSRFDEAIRAYEMALAITPLHKDARFNLAFAYFHKRDIKRALIECDKLLKQDPGYFKAVQLKSQLSP